MQAKLEIALKPELSDVEGLGIKKKLGDNLGVFIDSLRCINILSFEGDFSDSELETFKDKIFFNPLIQIASFGFLDLSFDFAIWVGFKPGVKDNAGARAEEIIRDFLGADSDKLRGVHSSKLYCFKAENFDPALCERIASKFLANDIIQSWEVFLSREAYEKKIKELIIPKLDQNLPAEIQLIPIDSDELLEEISRKRDLGLNKRDIPVIREYFSRPDVLALRLEKGLSLPTDIEMEYIAQGRSDHCNHNTFRGLFRYKDLETGESLVFDNLFKSFIQQPTLEMQKEKDWVVSVLWDNAGAASFDENWNYVITGETHNSPSNMEAYGGANTGLLGVFRDVLGTGKGSKLIMGAYGLCIGELDYKGELKPRLHPSRILDDAVRGIGDAANKSGVPLNFGQLSFHPGYMGKCLVFASALGLMPKLVKGELCHEKKSSPGDLIVVSGGRVGRDGIHGVTTSSDSYSSSTLASHVQIGDPYLQKKLHDFILEARDAGLIEFITDNGGGGLSSSIGESARFSGGCFVELDKVPLKYGGLSPWEIWISESQERMTLAVKAENQDAFMKLSEKHGVESTVIGRYTDSSYLEISWESRLIASVDINFLEEDFPQWEFDCEWIPPAARGFYEPVLGEPSDYASIFKALLSSPDIASKEWIVRRCDHEVQASSVIKPLVGKGSDIPSDAVVIRPLLDSRRGIAYTQSILPFYSKIDAGHMTSAVIDEAVRRLLVVGAKLSNIGGVDNFCWPDIQYHPEKNPDARFKAAQLVRSCRTLEEICRIYEIPLLSGKDSMYVDGHLPGLFGETHKVSALETLQFSASSIVEDVELCQTLDLKKAGDLVCLLGLTGDELGASAYYDLFSYTGLNVPRLRAKESLACYRVFEEAMKKGLISSAHAVGRGGLGLHLALVAMAGDLGIDIDLAGVKSYEDADLFDYTLLFSESCGRIIFTISEDKKEAVLSLFKDLPLSFLGCVKDEKFINIKGLGGNEILAISLAELKHSFKQPFGDFI